MLCLEQVSKLYHNGYEMIYALREVNLKIEKGEFVSVLGASGSGKSTLMNILGGLDRPSIGRVLYWEQDIGRFSDGEISRYRNKEVGFVFQNFNLNPNLTALENVAAPLIYGRIPRRKRAAMAMEALERVQLADRAAHRPGELSGGQRQRVSIARAIVNAPGIVLADEPTGNLDTASGERVMELLSDLSARGLTVVMVTHNAQQAQKCSRMIEIRDGSIARDVIC